MSNSGFTPDDMESDYEPVIISSSETDFWNKLHEELEENRTFVNELRKIPGAWEELVRRTKLIEKRCVPCSDYGKARAKILATYGEKPVFDKNGKMSRGEFSLARLFNDRPKWFSGTMTIHMECIEWISQDPDLAITDAQQEAYMELYDCCKAIYDEAISLDVEGCFWIEQMFLYQDPDAAQLTTAPLAKTAWSMFSMHARAAWGAGGPLTLLSNAQKLLMEWVAQREEIP